LVDVLELELEGTTRSAMQTQEGIIIDKNNKAAVKDNRTGNHRLNLPNITHLDAIVFNAGKNNSKKHTPAKTIKPLLLFGFSAVDE